MFIRIEASSGVPISRQIADQIRSQCASKALKPGDRLPSVRALARELAVNQNTILRVYERLTMEGLLERRHGAGTYVSQRIPTGRLEAHQLKLLRNHIDQLVFKAVTLNLSHGKVRELLDQAFEQIDHQSKQSEGKTNE